MSRIFIVLSVALILFGGAAGLSWYFQPQMQTPDASTEKEGEGKTAKALPKKANASHQEGTESKLGKTFPPNPDASRAAQAIATIQVREESIKARELHFAVREKQLNAIHDEIKKEHAKLEVVRKEIQTELNNVKKKLEEVELRTADATKSKKDIAREIERLQLIGNNVKQNEAKNAQANAPIFDKLDPIAASSMINQMLESGKGDEAALILKSMKAPQAAAVYSELNRMDTSVATKLLERMMQIKIPENKK